MNDTVNAAPARTREREWAGTRILDQRRRILLNPAFQLRAVVSISGLTLLLVAGVDATYFALQQTLTARTLAIAPELKEMLRGQDQLEMAWILVGSVVFMLGVAAVTFIESHRTAGPIYKLARTMERTGAEGPVLRLRLRKDDHFREIEEIFNGMASSLQVRASMRSSETRRILDEVDEAVEALSRPGVPPSDVQNRLRVVAADLQKLEESIGAC
jgi:methyl-accepting chemotaxis protein